MVSNRQEVELVKLDLIDDSSQCFQASLGLCEISFVDFKSDEYFHTAPLGSNGGISNSQKGIEHRFDPGDAMQSDAPFGELNRKRRRMRSLLCAALNCLVGNEPRVAPTA